MELEEEIAKLDTKFSTITKAITELGEGMLDFEKKQNEFQEALNKNTKKVRKLVEVAQDKIATKRQQEDDDGFGE